MKFLVHLFPVLMITCLSFSSSQVFADNRPELSEAAKRSIAVLDTAIALGQYHYELFSKKFVLSNGEEQSQISILVSSPLEVRLPKNLPVIHISGRRSWKAFFKAYLVKGVISTPLLGTGFAIGVATDIPIIAGIGVLAAITYPIDDSLAHHFSDVDHPSGTKNAYPGAVISSRSEASSAIQSMKQNYRDAMKGKSAGIPKEIILVVPPNIFTLFSRGMETLKNTRIVY